MRVSGCAGASVSEGVSAGLLVWCWGCLRVDVWARGREYLRMQIWVSGGAGVRMRGSGRVGIWVCGCECLGVRVSRGVGF